MREARQKLKNDRDVIVATRGTPPPKDFVTIQVEHRKQTFKETQNKHHNRRIRASAVADSLQYSYLLFCTYLPTYTTHHHEDLPFHSVSRSREQPLHCGFHILFAGIRQCRRSTTPRTKQQSVGRRRSTRRWSVWRQIRRKVSACMRQMLNMAEHLSWLDPGIENRECSFLFPILFCPLTKC